MMDDLLWNQIFQHPDLAPHIILDLLEHRYPRVEVPSLKQIVEAQTKTLTQMRNICAELWSRVNSLTEKANIMGNK